MTLLTTIPERIADRARQVRALSLIPPELTLIICLIGIDSASFWRDEAATSTPKRGRSPPCSGC